MRPAPDESALVAGEVIAGRYRVEELLGEGGGGSVYAGRHVELDKPVAIKVLRTQLSASAAFRARFEREARVCARLRHPGAVGVHDFGVHDGRLFLIMDRLMGASLWDHLEVGQPFHPPEQTLPIAIEIADVLGAAHDIPLVHRDVKPGNVILEPQPQGAPRVVLVDFGLAFISDGDDLGRMTVDGMISGTPEYLSPEQARGLEVGPPADIYSFGCLLYEMVTGDPPFTGLAMEVVTRQMYVPASSARARRPDRNIPETLDALILEMLHKAAGHRPTAREVKQRLVEIMEGTAPHPRTRMPRTRVSRMVEAPAVPDAEPAVTIGRARVAVIGEPPDAALITACASNGIDLVHAGGAPGAGDAEAVLAPAATPQEVAALVGGGLPVIAGARSGDLARLTPLLRAGAAEIVSLPLDASDVARKLGRVLRERRRMHPARSQEP